MPKDNYSEPRRLWLEELDRQPGSLRPRGNVGMTCQKLGWTRWCETMPGEELTDAGRRKLRDWNLILNREAAATVEYESWVPANAPPGGRIEQSAYREGYAHGMEDERRRIAGMGVPATDRSLLERAYEDGWCAAAHWARREDLEADIGSPAYIADRDGALDALGVALPDGGQR